MRALLFSTLFPCIRFIFVTFLSFKFSEWDEEQNVNLIALTTEIVLIITTIFPFSWPKTKLQWANEWARKRECAEKKCTYSAEYENVIKRDRTAKITKTERQQKQRLEKKSRRKKKLKSG